MSSTVGIEELKVGMFVHLDLGWWAHPFARSSFLITEADQIETIKGLGLGRVRWSPEKSRLGGEGGGLLDDDAAPDARPGLNGRVDGLASRPRADVGHVPVAHPAPADGVVSALRAVPSAAHGVAGAAHGVAGEVHREAPDALAQVGVLAPAEGGAVFWREPDEADEAVQTAAADNADNADEPHRRAGPARAMASRAVPSEQGIGQAVGRLGLSTGGDSHAAAATTATTSTTATTVAARSNEHGASGPVALSPEGRAGHAPLSPPDSGHRAADAVGRDRAAQAQAVRAMNGAEAPAPGSPGGRGANGALVQGSPVAGGRPAHPDDAATSGAAPTQFARPAPGHLHSPGRAGAAAAGAMPMAGTAGIAQAGFGTDPAAESAPGAVQPGTRWVGGQSPIDGAGASSLSNPAERADGAAASRHVPVAAGTAAAARADRADRAAPSSSLAPTAAFMRADAPVAAGVASAAGAPGPQARQGVTPPNGAAPEAAALGPAGSGASAAHATDHAGAAAARPPARPRDTRSRLQAQREADQVCQQQMAEARDGCRQVHEQVRTAPHLAREQAEQLTKAMVSELLASPDACVRTLADASADPTTAHALNVMVVSLLVGRVVGLSESALVHLGQGAMLHDIGKLDLTLGVRHAELALDAEATAQYRSHVALGMAQGERMGLPNEVLKVIAQHHEMVDGSGFPTGCGHDAIGPGARIVALVNRYDNLCNPAHEAQGVTPHEALAMLFAQSRGRFDAAVLNAFIRMMGVYPPGSVVQLTDERFATVVKVNAARPLKPRVLVADLSVPVDEALLLDLDEQPDLGVRRSLRAAQLPPEVREYLSPQPRMVYFFESASATAGTEALAA